VSHLGSRIPRNIAALLVFILFVGLLPAQVFANEPNSLTDIKGHWAEKSINKVIQEGLFKGSAEGVFEPQGSMTRAMFVTVLNRLAEKLDGPDVAVKEQTFTDVPANAWYAKAISWAVSAGLTEGYGNGTFGPNDLLNREQITVLMLRFLTTYMKYDLSSYQSSALFADSGQISSWAKEAVYQAVALGLVQGETGNRFNPKGTASRAVVAVITERLLEKSARLKVDKPSETLPPTEKPSQPEKPTQPSTPGTTTPPSGGNGGGGNGGNGGGSTIKVTAATIQRDNKEVSGTVIRSGDQLTVAVTPSNATKTVKWIINGKVKLEAEKYTVKALDVGSVITVEVTGSGGYSGTVTSAATGKVVASVDLANKNPDSAPVIVAGDVKYMDEKGEEISLKATDTITFSITASANEVPKEEQENVAAALDKEFANKELDVVALHIKYLAIDAKLLVESEGNNASEVHPIGKTTLTLSKANLGIAANEDIGLYTFVIGHTNKKSDQENLIGKVVEINGEQYVRVELNGLSTIYIGSISPLTVTFDTDGGSVIEPKKVKLGELTPEVAAPTKDGHIFLGWNVDLNQSPIFMNRTIKALWTDDRTATRERTFDIDRGVGTVEVMLLANAGSGYEDYYSDIHGYLKGNTVWNTNYSLSLSASFNKRILLPTGPNLRIDYRNYAGFKLIFTPFTNDSYTSKTVKASARYWAEDGTDKFIDLDTKLNDKGQLEVITKTHQSLKEMAGELNFLNIIVTVEVDGQSQEINLYVYDLSDKDDEAVQHINTDQWTKVVETFAENQGVFVSYHGEAVTLNKLLELKPNQRLDISNSSLTIGSGGELRVAGSADGGSSVHVNGEIKISSGGKITTSSQQEFQRSYYGSSVFASSMLTVEPGGEVTVPEIGYLSLGSLDRVVIKQDGILNVKGSLGISKQIELDGILNISSKDESSFGRSKGNVEIHGDLVINKLVNVSNAYLNVSGMTTIKETGELRLTKGNTNLNGKTDNRGKITVQQGYLTLLNVGHAVHNAGIIELAADTRLTILGTTLVNNKTITGSGEIVLTEDINATEKYNSGIKLVDVDGTHSPSNYSRSKFVSDPDAKVTATIYESKMSGTGLVAPQIKVTEIKIPE